MHMFRRFIAHPIIITVAALLIMIIAQRLGVTRPIERAFAAVFYPVQSVLYRTAVRVRELPLFRWSSERNYDAQIDALMAERAALVMQLSQYRFAGEENKTLRQLLKFQEEKQETTIAARVISRKTDSGTFVVYLDRGTRDGVRVGMPVVTANGILVGKINAVHTTLAEAVFLPDPRFRAASTFVDNIGTAGVVRGEGGVSIILDLIPASYALKKGTLVATSGLESGVPRGYVIGTVDQSMDSENDQLFRRASITPMLSLARITDVAIVVPPRP